MDKSGEPKLQVTVSDDGEVLSLSGQLTFDNAHDGYRDFSRLSTGEVVRIDCSGLAHADSTALALLLTGAGLAREKERVLQIEGLNPRLQSLARVYGVEPLLGLKPADSRQD
ncbi:MAG: STAS domain-containing protein [Gammaproteobacteria bacterium]|jgi:ABC-type transporter Mla MlaB component